MVDNEYLLEIVPHYIALLGFVFLVLFAIRTTVGSLGFWIELLLVLTISIAYQPVVRRLGVAPTVWEK